jgi:hypothetical protein
MYQGDEWHVASPLPKGCSHRVANFHNIYPPSDAIIVNDLHSARIIACQDPLNVLPKTRFFAGLLGSLLASEKFVETKGKVGVALAFKPAIKVKRLLFMTPAFVRDNTDLCRELAEVLQLQDCNFQLLNRGLG